MRIKILIISSFLLAGRVYGQTVPNNVYDFLNLDAVTPVGQFVVGNGYNMTNAPLGDSGYWNVISMRHHNPGNNFTTQIAGEFFGNTRLFFRNTNNTNNTTWNEIYHSGNINTLKSTLGIDPNILTGLNGPAYGVNVKMDIPGYSGGWARGFTISDENANPFFGLGAFGSGTNGVMNFDLGWIGRSYDDSHMNFLPNGNVGVGTTTPREKLSVNGKIRAKEIKVETANWPDYVFEDTYKPKTLTEIEKFIKANKHLPEVPSAKEVEQNGVELGEMNKILLKKIEELTLLLIEQNKRIEKLEKNN